MTKARWVVVFTLAAVSVVPAWGQAGGQAAAAPAPPPMPKPNAALAQLNFFAGVWHCTGTGYTEGKGHPVVSTATLRWQLNDSFTKKSDDEVADTGEVRMNGAWTRQFELVCHRQGTR